MSGTTLIVKRANGIKRAAVCDKLSQIADVPSATEYLEYYRKNLMGIGKMITYAKNGQKHTAKMEGINDLGEILVIDENEQKHLCSSERTITSIEADSR